MNIIIKRNVNSLYEHICFGESEKYFKKIEADYKLDFAIKDFIEGSYDHIVNLWNRFVRYKTRKEKPDSRISKKGPTYLTGIISPRMWLSTFNYSFHFIYSG